MTGLPSIDTPLPVAEITEQLNSTIANPQPSTTTATTTTTTKQSINDTSKYGTHNVSTRHNKTCHIHICCMLLQCILPIQY